MLIEKHGPRIGVGPPNLTIRSEPTREEHLERIPPAQRDRSRLVGASRLSASQRFQPPSAPSREESGLSLSSGRRYPGPEPPLAVAGLGAVGRAASLGDGSAT